MGTVLVAGGAGYIGSHAVLALRDAGHDCVVLDNLVTGFREAVPTGVPLIVADTADSRTVSQAMRTHRVDAVLHFAASLVVPESVARPLDYYGNNVAGTIGLLRAMLQADVGRLVFSSTAAVYGQPDRVPVDEGAPLRPINPYGWSKAMAERVIRDAAAAHGLSATILRYFNVAGADPQLRAGQRTLDATHLIKVACETALGRRPQLRIFGTDWDTADGTCVRDYIHVSDLADAHVLALRALADGGPGVSTFNCGYGRGFTVRQVIDAVGRAVGGTVPAVAAPRRAGDAASIVADPTLLRSRLGWRPAHDDLDGIVRSALEWERRQPRQAA